MVLVRVACTSDGCGVNKNGSDFFWVNLSWHRVVLWRWPHRNGCLVLLREAWAVEEEWPKLPHEMEPDGGGEQCRLEVDIGVGNGICQRHWGATPFPGTESNPQN